MSPTVRNVLAIIAGIVVGSVVNSALVMLSPMLIPPPAGVDTTSAEGLRAGIHLFGPRHFVMPLLAHALGTLAGALVAYLVAATHRARMAWAIGVVFLVGGIAASAMIPAPGWFKVVDLVFAYLPMAWTAIAIGERVGAPAAPWPAATPDVRGDRG